jgi:hypothetical protein
VVIHWLAQTLRPCTAVGETKNTKDWFQKIEQLARDKRQRTMAHKKTEGD